MPKYTIGFAYVLSNRAMPGMVKVGWTSQLGEDRAKKLYTTGLPLPFDVEFGAATSFPEEVEAEADSAVRSLWGAHKALLLHEEASRFADAIKWVRSSGARTP